MQTVRKIGGVLLIVIGFLALITPLTPGAWLIFVGLEIIGIRLALWDKILNKLRAWVDRRREIRDESAPNSNDD